MSKLFGIFTEDGGEFSWRKAMTAGCLIIFLTAQLGWLISTGFKVELPTAYWSLDAGVFAFYFFKKTLGDIRINSK